MSEQATETEFDGDGDGELGFFDTVSELEDDAEDYAADESGEGVDGQDGPPAMEEHGDAEGHGEEDDLAGDEHEEVFALGAGDFVAADVAGGNLLKIVHQMPFDGEESVQKPEIDALHAMEPVAPLLGRQPAEEAEVDVVILPVDVGEGVMNRVVLPVPEVAASAHEIEGEGHDAVDPGALGIGAVAAVVLDVKADCGDGEAEDDGKRNRRDPTCRDEEEQEIGREEPGEDRRGLEIHLWAIAAGMAGALEVSVDALAQLAQETVAPVEFESCCGKKPRIGFRGNSI